MHQGSYTPVNNKTALFPHIPPETAMDAMDRTEKLQAAATAVGALIAFVPAASWSASVFVAILAALGVGSLAGGAVMVHWSLTDEGNAYLKADSRISGRSTSRTSLWMGNLAPGFILVGLAVLLHLR
ncbi:MULTISPECIES: hypothetical protein [Acidovorax]|uniref:hypothetical protein n=1 Tax=Acidovorax TaxID=12916 RepID=UPI0025C51D21|nr:hypothetical protein [Acidovorax sp.]